MRLQCAADGCSEPAEEGYSTCSDRVHREAENEKRKAAPAYQDLQRRLRKGNVPTTSRRSFKPMTDAQDLEEYNEDASSDSPVDPSSSTLSKGPKVRLTRKYTHNEQLFIYSCGIIVSRGTLFSAEGILAVKVKRVSLLSHVRKSLIHWAVIAQVHVSISLASSNVHILRQSLPSSKASPSL